MSESDWDSVTILRKKTPKASELRTTQAVNNAFRTGQDVETTKKFAAGSNRQHTTAKNTAKLDQETEDLHHDTVGIEVGHLIAQGRTAKGWTQKDLATKANEKQQIINEYEAGKAIPNPQILTKLERLLEIKLRGKDKGQPLEPRVHKKSTSAANCPIREPVGTRRRNAFWDVPLIDPFSAEGTAKNKMAQDLQVISEGLERAPFNRKTSILDLDALNGQPALQFLNDVFASLDTAHAGSISDEEPQETAVRMFMFLRLIRYPSPEDADELSTWRQDVVEGKRRVLIPVLLYIVRNIQMVQQRVYLAKYMIKIDVPPELRADSEINQICEEQDRLVAEFAVVHKNATQLKADADIVNEYRQEIKDLRLQKNQTEARVADLLTRVRSMPGRSAEKEERMALAHKLREERENCTKLMVKRTELLQLAPPQTERIARLKEYTTKMTNDWLKMTPEKLLKKLEDRLTIQRRAVKEVLPKTIAEERAAVAELQNLVNLPEFTDKSLNELRIKAQMLQTEVFNMSDKLRTAVEGPEQTQLAVYRNQLDAAAAKKRDFTSRNDTTYQQIRELEKQLRLSKGNEFGDVESLSAKLMQSSEDFTKKQQTIKQLEVERSNMIRSNAVLAEEAGRIGKVLTEWRSERRQPGIWTKTTTKRQQVTDLLAELQPLRQRHQVQLDVLARERAKLGSSASGSGDLEQQVDKFRAEVLDMEDKMVASQVQLQYLEVLEKRAQDAQGDDKFLKSVQSEVKRETARLEQLRAAATQAKADQAKTSQQATAWRDLNLLFDMKAEHLQQDLELAESKSGRFGSADGVRDRIVMS
ncbi:putative Endothelial differentiation-related factor 1-like protein [Hypsibius exemplaris]|uniref:Endothelial differentiation-related factor 1-like protein n=1 Tax=Hypsibius exemplaris TaxID=2072580 RepID=A0A1W0X441_HYPEX|nr:putative Endothelial differentiation-related factor 1-like protein [Hypsibius exemplaris]